MHLICFNRKYLPQLIQRCYITQKPFTYIILDLSKGTVLAATVRNLSINSFQYISVN
jgi:hypothetical protein